MEPLLPTDYISLCKNIVYANKAGTKWSKSSPTPSTQEQSWPGFCMTMAECSSKVWAKLWGQLFTTCSPTWIPSCSELVPGPVLPLHSELPGCLSPHSFCPESHPWVSFPKATLYTQMNSPAPKAEAVSGQKMAGSPTCPYED